MNRLWHCNNIHTRVALKLPNSNIKAYQLTIKNGAAFLLAGNVNRVKLLINRNHTNSLNSDRYIFIPTQIKLISVAMSSFLNLSCSMSILDPKFSNHMKRILELTKICKNTSSRFRTTSHCIQYFFQLVWNLNDSVQTRVITSYL